MKKLRIVILLSLFAPFLLAAPRWWKKITPKGETIACESASNSDAMIAVLARAGWDTATIPTVNWGSEYVVIIAPEHSYTNMELVYGRSEEVNGEYHILYGWQPFPPDNTNSNSATFGSRTSGPETIAVSVPNSVAPSRLFCVGYPPG